MGTVPRGKGGAPEKEVVRRAVIKETVVTARGINNVNDATYISDVIFIFNLHKNRHYMVIIYKHSGAIEVPSQSTEWHACVFYIHTSAFKISKIQASKTSHINILRH